MRYEDEPGASYDWCTPDGQRLLAAAVEYARAMDWDPEWHLEQAAYAGDDGTRSMLVQVLGRLSVGDQELLQARYWDGASIGEIAGDLGIERNAAEKRLSRARARLREQIEAMVP